MRAGVWGEGDPWGPRRGLCGEGRRGCGSSLAPGSTLLPPSSSESERPSSSTVIFALSVRNVTHSMTEAITTFVNPSNPITSHSDISFDATTP